MMDDGKPLFSTAHPVPTGWRRWTSRIRVWWQLRRGFTPSALVMEYITLPQLDFMECDSCRAKPGTPPLCRGCFHNRELISSLKRAFRVYQDSQLMRSYPEKGRHRG